MRRKKHKHTRRTIRFYRINYGFRPPFKVILDGNFVHALESMKRGDAKDLLSKLLGEPVKLYTTKCVMHELRAMGKEYADTRQACKRACALHKCGHDEEHASAAECLLTQLGQSNPDHFFIATQDRGLQSKVMKVPGGAVVFASVNGLHLEMPSAMQKQQVKQVEEEHMSVKPQERQSAALGGLEQAQQGGGPAFRRKKPKGPNPLAAKPKQKKPQQAQQAQQQRGPTQQKQLQQEGGDGGQAGQGGGRKRQRRRRKGEGAAGGSGAEDA